jgi:hypothetical protein
MLMVKEVFGYAIKKIHFLLDGGGILLTTDYPESLDFWSGVGIGGQGCSLSL